MPLNRRTFTAALVSAPLALTAPLTSQAKTMKITPIAARPEIAFAEACEASGFSRMLFIAGQVPQDGDYVPDDYESQYRLAWKNVERQLTAADMTFDNLVKATIYLSDRSLIAKSKGLRGSILGGRTPAITIVIVGIYDERWLLEIEAVAVA